MFSLFVGYGLGDRKELFEQARKAADQTSVRGEPLRSSPLPQRDFPETAELEELARSAPLPKRTDGYIPLTFDPLSDFEYPIDMSGSVLSLPDGSKPTIPERVKKFDKQRISLSGYMLPLHMEAETVTEFILIKNQLLCCYGQTPDVNEWAIVVMERPVPTSLDEPVTVSGTLQVGEATKDGQLLCIYRLSGERLEVMDL